MGRACQISSLLFLLFGAFSYSNQSILCYLYLFLEKWGHWNLVDFFLFLCIYLTLCWKNEDKGIGLITSKKKSWAIIYKNAWEDREIMNKTVMNTCARVNEYTFRSITWIVFKLPNPIKSYPYNSAKVAKGFEGYWFKCQLGLIWERF